MARDVACPPWTGADPPASHASLPTSQCHVLAIDLGTGGPKVALVSGEGRISAHAGARVPLHLVTGGGAEQDPADWWDAVVDACKRVLSQGVVSVDHIVAVSCTAQWSGTVAVDAEGNPLHRAIIWMDSRGNAAIRRQTSGTVNVLGYDIRKIQRWIRLTGGAPGHSGKDPTAHILWLRDAHPEIHRATHTFLEPVDWLNHQLTGRLAASHDSIVAHWVTDNRRISAIDYDPILLKMSGLDREQLPDLVPTGTIVGGLRAAAAEALGLPVGLPVSTGSGDLHSAAIGSGAVAIYDPHLYIGTSSWISCHLPFKKTDATHNVASIPAALAGKYLVADEHETAGACLTFLAENLLFADGAGAPAAESAAAPASSGAVAPASSGAVAPASESVYRTLDGVASSVPAGAHQVLFTPWLNGERSPVDDHTIRGGFHNMSLATTRDDLVRSVYEGVAFNSRWLLEAVEKFVDRRFDSLAFIGGGANSDLWAQIHADVMRRTIRQVEDPVLANVRGAGLLSFVAMGRIRPEDIHAMVEIRASYHPDPSTETTYDTLFAEFVNLYKQTKAIHRRLNRF